MTVIYTTYLVSHIPYFGIPAPHNFSGLKTNFEKTQILRIGTDGYIVGNDVIDTNLPIRWVEKVRILGINFVADTENLLQQNISDITRKVEMLIQAWSTRSLIPLGKITVINSLLISQFVYKLMLVHSPGHEFFVRIHKMLREFIEDKKKARISFKQLTRKLEGDGLQLFNIEIKNIVFKAQWIKRSENSPCILGTACQTDVTLGHSDYLEM